MFSPNFLLASGSQHVRRQCFRFRFASVVVLVRKSLCHMGNVLQQRQLIAFSHGNVLKRKGALISLDSDQLSLLALQTRFPPYFLPNPNSHSTLPQAEALWLSLLTGTAVCCLGIQADLLGHPECPSSLPEKLYLTLLMHLACDFVRFKLWCQERNTTVNETEEIVGSHGQIKSYLIQPGRSLPHRLPGRWMLGGVWAHISVEGSHTGRHRHMLAHMLHRDKTQANRQTHTGRQPKDKG